MDWVVYIMLCADGTLYTGITTDIERRTKEHNSGAGAKYTRSRRPVKPVYVEKCADKGAALRREIEIKRISREKKLRLIDGKIEV